MALAENTTVLADVGVLLASSGESVRAALDHELWSWLDSAEWNARVRTLKEKHGQRGAIPTKWAEIPAKVIAMLHPNVHAQCQELNRLGLERKAIRLAYCRKLAHVYVCPECGRPGKKISSCKNAYCLSCAKRNFGALFRRFLQVDSLIPAAVRSQPGWGWCVLDFSFRHDGDFPKQWELRAMVKVIRRTVERAVREKCQELHRARQGCRLRLSADGSPMMSYDGWPIAGAPDGEARELVGWTVFSIAEHSAPDNAARKHGERGAKKRIPAHWKLRFGFELIRVREFGFDNVNAHFHCAYFGPRLDYWKEKDNGRLICGGRLVEIFKQETRRPVEEGGLGEESYTVFFEEAHRGFRSVLAHALKYTAKLPSSTPEGLAQLEHAVQGTRRVALLGAHYGVPLKSKPRDPHCPTCNSAMGRVMGLGLVPLLEIEDLPDVIEDREDLPDVVEDREDDLHEPGADEFMEEEVRGP